MKILLLALVAALPLSSYAQEDTLNVSTELPGDKVLDDVTIRAYGLDRSLRETPASIATIGTEQLGRFGNGSVVSAINSKPGVHIDERSPGSYRLNFRGSSLRSPFGVRNVKIYYNDIPITDPGGFSYFNQVGFYNISQLQIIKGPGSSLYGAGNGGVMLISSLPDQWHAGTEVGYTAGSYGFSNTTAAIRLGDANSKTIIRYQHQNSDGYRVRTRSKRDVISLDALLKANAKNELSAHFLYNELYYETPGALTLAEYDTEPKNSRPKVGSTPGAIEANAAIFQKNATGGLSFKHHFNAHLQNTTTVYVSYTDFKNPGIRNYGKSIEPHFGARTSFGYKANIGKSELNMQVGGEAQQEYALFQTFKNKAGNPDTLQTNDAINAKQYFGFLQANWKYKTWIVEAGASLNRSSTTLARLSASPYKEYNKDFNTQVSPRIAIMRAGKTIAPYINVAKGFSPPTAAELSPSGSAINFSLAPEQGWSYEAGIRGAVLNRKIHYDVNIFYFQLSQAIVLRRDSAGGDYYINAGKTNQRGIEAYLDYQVVNNKGIIDLCKLWMSYTGNDFKYQDFKQINSDYSGNQLPGTAPNAIAAGLDLAFRFGLTLNATYYYSDRIALDDANMHSAAAYHLLGCKLSYKRTFSKITGEVFVGADNILDQRYSLGNDINAAGGRFYNAAPGANYFAGIFFGYAR